MLTKYFWYFLQSLALEQLSVWIGFLSKSQKDSYSSFVSGGVQLTAREIVHVFKSHYWYKTEVLHALYFEIVGRTKSKTYMKFLSAPPFLFIISKAHNMKWKNLNSVFDENVSFNFYGPSKFFRFGDFVNFFQNFQMFQTQINCMFFCN